MFLHGPHVWHIRWDIYATHLQHILHTSTALTGLYNQTNMYSYWQTISHLFNMWDVRTWTTCATHQVGHICHIFSTHIAHIYCSNWTIQSDEHGPILGDYITSLQHVRCSYMTHIYDSWYHVVIHICKWKELFSRQIDNIFCNWFVLLQHICFWQLLLFVYLQYLIKCNQNLKISS